MLQSKVSGAGNCRQYVSVCPQRRRAGIYARVTSGDARSRARLDEPYREGPGTMALDFARDDTLVAVADHASCELGGEAVLLDLTTGVYYGLDPVGTRVWRLLQQPRSLAELGSIVVRPAQLER